MYITRKPSSNIRRMRKGSRRTAFAQNPRTQRSAVGTATGRWGHCWWRYLLSCAWLCVRHKSSTFCSFLKRLGVVVNGVISNSYGYSRSLKATEMLQVDSEEPADDFLVTRTVYLSLFTPRLKKLCPFCHCPYLRQIWGDLKD